MPVNRLTKTKAAKGELNRQKKQKLDIVTAIRILPTRNASAQSRVSTADTLIQREHNDPIQTSPTFAGRAFISQRRDRYPHRTNGFQRLARAACAQR